MVKDRISIQRDKKDGWYVVVDGAVKECQGFGEALDIIRRETGDTASSKKWEELKAENAKLRAVIDSAARDLEAMTADRDKYKSWWAEAYDENRQLKAAIVRWFVRAFNKEG